jgi:hypothetical protein
VSTLKIEDAFCHRLIWTVGTHFLMVTHKTAPLVSLNAVLVDVFLLMTLRAIIHFHPIPGITLKSGDILAPDIPAIAGNAIFFIDF